MDASATKYGYVRVSSKDQHIDRQLIALDGRGVHRKHVFVDELSGKDFNRPMYQKMLKKLKENDVLYILSIDRLGRNYEEILNQWRYITKEIGADIVVIDMPLLDTRRGKDLLGTFLSDIVLQVLSFVSENERNNIKERQAQGIAAAKAKGVQFGRPPVKLSQDFYRQYDKWRQGATTITEAANACGMSKSTFYRRAVETLPKK